MVRYSSEVTIDRPPEVVYRALLDPHLYSRWTDMVEVSFEGADPPVVGTRGRFRLAKGPIKGMLQMELTELEPDRRVVFHVTHPDLDWTSISTLEPADSGTRLTYAGELRLLGWRRLLEPLMGREVRAGEAEEARRLKRCWRPTRARRPRRPDVGPSSLTGRGADAGVADRPRIGRLPDVRDCGSMTTACPRPSEFAACVATLPSRGRRVSERDARVRRHPLSRPGPLHRQGSLHTRKQRDTHPKERHP